MDLWPAPDMPTAGPHDASRQASLTPEQFGIPELGTFHHPVTGERPDPVVVHRPPGTRLLVTGSRYWINDDVMSSALVAARWLLAAGRATGITLVTGGAAGADARAALLWEQLTTAECSIEQHPLTNDDWKRGGKSAGPRRNARMVALGADLCVGFLDRERDGIPPAARLNNGTRGCLALARAAGIPRITVWSDGSLRG